MMLMLSSGMKYEVKQPMSQIMGSVMNGNNRSIDQHVGEANHLVLQRSSGIIPGSHASVKKTIVEILHTVGAKKH